MKKQLMLFIILLIMLIAILIGYTIAKKNYDPLQRLIFETNQKQIDMTIPVQFQHPDWTDTMILEGNNRMYRESILDYATIIERTPDSYTIKWDKWGTETFKKDPQDGIYKKVKKQ